MSENIILIKGPTASGKTDLAISLLEEFPIEIVSVDSVMVYKGLNIGTAKPSDALLKKYPHHLVNICEPHENYSVGQFYQDVSKAIQLIVKKGKVPLLVGGTMMYFRAIQQGLSNLPTSNASLREQIETEARINGWPYMHGKLKEVDPISAKKIKPTDKQRIERALEVYQISGKPISQHHKEKSKSLNYNYFNISLIPTIRSKLHSIIANRLETMIDEGLVDEVRVLLNSEQVNSTCNSMKSVGYKQICQYLINSCTLEEAKEDAKTSTRRLAKRQLTWLRSESSNIEIDIHSDSIIDKSKSALDTFLNKNIHD
tara:strand:+ start:950 stop:1891 length:942 start_codon:yes stop_codon:yes gene_type:complete